MSNVTESPVLDKDSNDIEIINGSLTDLKYVYNLLLEDFAAEELKGFTHFEKLMMKKKYKLLLAKHTGFNEIIGYAFVYEINQARAIWLDYIAVVKRFRNLGLGTQLFTKIVEAYQEGISGIFIEVEIPEEREGQIRDNQIRRIHFYERLGASKLDFPYELPTNKGGFPMYLYFKPCSGGKLPEKKQIKVALSSAFDYIHSDVKNRDIVLKRCFTSIEN